MKLGQRAMIAAKVRDLLKNNKSTTVAAKEAGVAQSYVAQASVVLQYANDQVEGLHKGSCDKTQ
jgi:hypothetical protein